MYFPGAILTDGRFSFSVWWTGKEYDAAISNHIEIIAHVGKNKIKSIVIFNVQYFIIKIDAPDCWIVFYSYI